MTQTGSEYFKDPTGLMKWARGLLYVQIIISVIAVIADAAEYQVLSNIQNDVYQSEFQAVSAAEASDQLQGIIGITQVGSLLFFLVMYYQWLYRANYNARQLGATEMLFTPGWSVGWYFIPFANLWKPYQAMKELWKVNMNPQDWRNLQIPAFIGWWWFFWLLSNFVSTLSFRLTLRTKSIEDAIAANIATVVSDALEIPLSMIMISLVSKLYTMQMSRYREYLAVRSAPAGDM